jgi:hypothetical protein
VGGSQGNEKGSDKQVKLHHCKVKTIERDTGELKKKCSILILITARGKIRQTSIPHTVKAVKVRHIVRH